MEDDNVKKREDEMIPIVPFAIGGVAKAVEMVSDNVVAGMLGSKLTDNTKGESLSATSKEEMKEEQTMETNRNLNVEQVDCATESQMISNPLLDMKKGKVMPSSTPPKFIAVRLELFAAVLANEGETGFLEFPSADKLFKNVCGESFKEFMGGLRPGALASDDEWRETAFCEFQKSDPDVVHKTGTVWVRTKLPIPNPRQEINNKMFDYVEAIVFAGKVPLEEIDYDLIARKFGSSRQYALLYAAVANRNKILNTPGEGKAKPGSLVAIAQAVENQRAEDKQKSRGMHPVSGRPQYFVGFAKWKPDPRDITGILKICKVVDVISPETGPINDVDIPYSRSTVGIKDGEFVVGVNPAKPYVFPNTKPGAVVQVLSWAAFVESKDYGSAVKFFTSATSGVLTSNGAPLLGNVNSPGHVIVFDEREDIFFKGFYSVGSGVVQYQDVQNLPGEQFRDLISRNKNTTEAVTYKGFQFTLFIPQRDKTDKKCKNTGRHPVIDCEEWLPLIKSELTFKTPGTQPDDVEPVVTGGCSAQTKAMADDSETIRIAQTESNGVVSPRYEDALKQSEPALKAPETQSDDAGADVVDGYSAQTKAMTGGGEKSGVNILVPLPRRESAAVGQDPEELKFVAKLIRVAGESGFDYAPRDLVRFHTSVKVGGFTVLGGLPGCGKSSLVALYARALLGKAKLDKDDSYLTIDVSPSWMEPEDILGHWGLNEHYVYAQTGLVKFLRRAVSVGDDRFPTMPIVCLEEMNLARVEHYFADFMQQLCRSEDERGLRGVPEFDGQEKPSEAFLPLSPSLRFVGTNNFDQTTQRFSPRFYDRSNYIELVDSRTSEPFSKGVPSYLNADFGSQVERTTYESWFNKEPSHDILEQAVVDKYKSLTEVFKKVNLPVSRRAEVAILVYVANRPFLSECGDDLSDQIACQMRALDEVIAQKILSRYTGSSYGGDTESEKQLKEKIADLPLSRELVINRSKGRERPSRL